MSDDYIFKLFNDYASDCTDTAQFAMDRDAFTAALREALAEELAEAVRLLSYLIQQIPGTGDCRAAARFVAEHGKEPS